MRIMPVGNDSGRVRYCINSKPNLLWERQLPRLSDYHLIERRPSCLLVRRFSLDLSNGTTEVTFFSSFVARAHTIVNQHGSKL